jgi:hypothetical protein
LLQLQIVGLECIDANGKDFLDQMWFLPLIWKNICNISKELWIKVLQVWTFPKEFIHWWHYNMFYLVQKNTHGICKKYLKNSRHTEVAP